MTSLTLSQDMLGLATGTEHRSKMARFREMFDQVCVALDAGVRHLAIRDVLARHGLDISIATLDVMISRVRRERAIPLPRHARQGATRRLAPVPATATPAASAPPAVVETPSAAPADASAVTPAPSMSPRQTLEEMAAAYVKPGVVLPDDWRTGPLTYEQRKSLTPAQRQERERASAEQFFPDPFKGWKPGQPLSSLRSAPGAARDGEPGRATPDDPATGTEPNR